MRRSPSRLISASLAPAAIFVIVAALSGCATAAPENDPAVSGPAAEDPQPVEEPVDDSGMPDPCTFLTQAQIEASTGYPVGPGYADPERQKDYSAVCEWTQVDGPGIVAVAIAPGYSLPYEAGEETPLGKTVAIEIRGADEAYSVSDGLTVAMSVNGDYISVAFSGAFDGVSGDTTIELATMVAIGLS